MRKAFVKIALASMFALGLSALLVAETDAAPRRSISRCSNGMATPSTTPVIVPAKARN